MGYTVLSNLYLISLAKGMILTIPFLFYYVDQRVIFIIIQEVILQILIGSLLCADTVLRAGNPEINKWDTVLVSKKPTI